MAENTATPEYPVNYLNIIDEAFAQESLSAKYNVQGAEFVADKTVKVPRIDFGENPGTTAYDGFKTKNPVETKWDVYTLANDRQAVFELDAIDAIDDHNIRLTNQTSEFMRVVFAPEVDTDFFTKCAAKAGTKATATIDKTSVKAELRKVATQMRKAGFKGADIYMSPDALGALEDAIDREFGGEGNITDEVGKYNMFTIYEDAEKRIGDFDFVAIGTGGKQGNAVRQVWKRDIHKQFSPEVYQGGDNWCDQFRWVYDTIALKNKEAGIYTNKAATAGAAG